MMMTMSRAQRRTLLIHHYQCRFSVTRVPRDDVYKLDELPITRAQCMLAWTTDNAARGFRSAPYKDEIHRQQWPRKSDAECQQIKTFRLFKKWKK